jgi:nitric oxide synthase-interacting protein
MCVDTLVLTDSQCAHCGIPLSSSSSSSSKKSSSSTKKEEGKYKGMIELKREGTGFAAGGMAEGKRFDLSFQG